VLFFNENIGARLGSVPARGAVFAQPVFAEGHLYVADEGGALTAW